MKPDVCVLFLVGALAGCAGSPRTTGADNRAGGPGACLPIDIVAAPPRAPTPPPEDGEDVPEPPPSRTFQLVNHAGRVHICADHHGANDARDACWEVDLGSGAVHDTAIVEDVGRTRTLEAAPSEQGICPGGYCLPGAEGADGDTTPYEAAIGAKVALVLNGDRGFIFGATDHQLRGELDWAKAAGDHGPSAAAGRPFIVGDVLFTGDFDAGPHADVHAWRSDGSPLGPVGDPAPRDDYGGEFELNDGGIAVLSDHEVAFLEHALARIFLVDTAAGTTTVWTRRLPPVPGCTDDAIRLFLDPTGVDFDFAVEDGTIPAPCLDALARVHGRFSADAGLTRTDGGLVALVRDPDGAALVQLDRAGAVRGEVRLPVCGR